MEKLALLFATDAVIYGNYVRSTLLIDAAAEAARVKMEHAARVSRRRMTEEVKRTKKKSRRKGR